MNYLQSIQPTNNMLYISHPGAANPLISSSSQPVQQFQYFYPTDNSVYSSSSATPMAIPSTAPLANYSPAIGSQLYAPSQSMLTPPLAQQTFPQQTQQQQQRQAQPVQYFLQTQPQQQDQAAALLQEQQLNHELQQQQQVNALATFGIKVPEPYNMSFMGKVGGAALATPEPSPVNSPSNDIIVTATTLPNTMASAAAPVSSSRPKTKATKSASKSAGSNTPVKVSFQSVHNAPAPLRTEDGRFQCTFCEKTYTHAKHLRRHMMRHTGEKPYKCSWCSTWFTRPDIRTRHALKCRLHKMRENCSEAELQNITPVKSTAKPKSNAARTPAACAASRVIFKCAPQTPRYFTLTGMATSSPGSDKDDKAAPAQKKLPTSASSPKTAPVSTSSLAKPVSALSQPLTPSNDDNCFASSNVFLQQQEPAVTEASKAAVPTGYITPPPAPLVSYGFETSAASQPQSTIVGSQDSNTAAAVMAYNSLLPTSPQATQQQVSPVPAPGAPFLTVAADTTSSPASPSFIPNASSDNNSSPLVIAPCVGNPSPVAQDFNAQGFATLNSSYLMNTASPSASPASAPAVQYYSQAYEQTPAAAPVGATATAAPATPGAPQYCYILVQVDSTGNAIPIDFANSGAAPAATAATSPAAATTSPVIAPAVEFTSQF